MKRDNHCAELLEAMKSTRELRNSLSAEKPAIRLAHNMEPRSSAYSTSFWARRMRSTSPTPPRKRYGPDIKQF